MKCCQLLLLKLNPLSTVVSLTEVSSDADDLEALTPNDFITGRATPNLPPVILLTRIYHVKSVGDKRKLLLHIWKRWLREYLPGLTYEVFWKWRKPFQELNESIFDEISIPKSDISYSSKTSGSSEFSTEESESSDDDAPTLRPVETVSTFAQRSFSKS